MYQKTQMPGKHTAVEKVPAHSVGQEEDPKEWVLQTQGAWHEEERKCPKDSLLLG